MTTTKTTRDMTGWYHSLEKLRNMNSERSRIERLIRLQVARCRGWGVPWRAIGEQMGISAQAAQQRYGDTGRNAKP
jgi:hypothetical protein